MSYIHCVCPVFLLSSFLGVADDEELLYSYCTTSKSTIGDRKVIFNVLRYGTLSIDILFISQ